MRSIPSSRFDNIQDELRRELDPKGPLEEEVFQALAQAAANRRRQAGSARYVHDRALFTAIRELHSLQSARRLQSGPHPPGRALRTAKVIPFPSAAA
jgi:hypothetical protein